METEKKIFCIYIKQKNMFIYLIIMNITDDFKD